MQPDGENLIKSTFSSSNADMTLTGVPFLTGGLNPDIYSSCITQVKNHYTTSNYINALSTVVCAGTVALWYHFSTLTAAVLFWYCNSRSTVTRQLK